LAMSMIMRTVSFFSGLNTSVNNFCTLNAILYLARLYFINE
jgi:hypothetical protein